MVAELVLPADPSSGDHLRVTTTQSIIARGTRTVSWIQIQERIVNIADSKHVLNPA